MGVRKTAGKEGGTGSFDLERPSRFGGQERKGESVASTGGQRLKSRHQKTARMVLAMRHLGRPLERKGASVRL